MKKTTLLTAFIILIINGFTQSLSPQMDDYGNRILTKSSQAIHQPNLDEGWTMIGPFGGDVLDVETNPQNSNQIFAAAETPYMSSDGGETWEIITGLVDIASSGIEVFGANSNGVILSGGTWNFGKVFKSTDEGLSWVSINIPENFGVSSIAFSPDDENLILMGLADFTGTSTNVVVKSTDGGNSWSAIDINVIPTGYNIVDITFDPDNTQTIVGIGRYSFNDAVAFISFDEGGSWENISSGLPSGKPFNSVEVAAGNIYVGGGQLFGSNFMGLYRSMDNGQSWENISTSFPKKIVNDLLIDPTDNDIMYAATEGDGVYKTTDGGSSWTYESSGQGDNGSVNSLVFHSGDNSILYAGFKSLGVCKSTDASINWEFANYGITSLALNDIAVVSDNTINPHYLIASFEGENSGGCYLSNDLGENWNIIESLPATRYTKVAASKDNSLYAWSNGPSSVAQEGLYKSTDGGETWNNMGPDLGTYFETEIWALCISEEDPNVIYIGGNNFGVAGWEEVIYKTTDGAETWEKVYEGLENFQINDISFIQYEADPEIIFAANYNKNNTGGGGIIRSSNNGHYWESVNNGIPASTNYCGSVSYTGYGNNVYGGVGGNMGTEGGIYVSEDQGDSWLISDLVLGNTNKFVDIFDSGHEQSLLPITMECTLMADGLRMIGNHLMKAYQLQISIASQTHILMNILLMYMLLLMQVLFKKN